MKPPIYPHDESERLACLKKQFILDTPLDGQLEKITRITKSLFNVPIVAVSLVDSERQWFKSIQGLDVTETSREVSFCGHAILQSEILLVEDALQDERFRDNPLVQGEPHIRFYAGCPISSPDGYKLGTLCIIDRVARHFSLDELAPLVDLASMACENICNSKQSQLQLDLLKELSEAERASKVDCLTRVWNRGAVEHILSHKISTLLCTKDEFSLILFDIDNFKSINDEHGHNAGDKVLQQSVKAALSCLRERDVIGRWGGDEFLILLDTGNQETALAVANRICEKASVSAVTHNEKKISFSLSAGVAFTTHQRNWTIEDVIEKADRALYDAKGQVST